MVWKDQKYLGPYSIEVVDKKVSWNGHCQGEHWNCTVINISFDDNNNVFKDEVTIGKIEKNEFQYALKDGSPLITYNSLRAYPESREVKASSVVNNQASEAVYSYNEKCSSEEAIIGSISLGLILKVQNKK